jgi:hypothetical protein
MDPLFPATRFLVAIQIKMSLDNNYVIFAKSAIEITRTLVPYHIQLLISVLV